MTSPEKSPPEKPPIEEPSSFTETTGEWLAQRVVNYFLVATAVIALAADLSGLSQGYEAADMNTIGFVIGSFAALAAVAMLVAHKSRRSTHGVRFFASRTRVIEFALVVVVALVMFAIGIFSTRHEEPPVMMQEPALVEAEEGIDLDVGPVPKQQDLPGVDLSPSRTGDQLNAMTHGIPRFAIADGEGGTNFERCSRVAADAWSKTLVDVYRLRTGTVVCVRTDKNNLAALVLTHVPSAGEHHLAFDFTTWRTS